MPDQLGNLPPSLQIPQPNRPVPSRRSRHPPIRRHGHASDPPPMPAHDPLRRPLPQPPQQNLAVIATADNAQAIRRKSHRIDRRLMPMHQRDSRSRLQVPKHHRVIKPGTRHPRPITRNRNALDHPAMPDKLRLAGANRASNTTADHGSNRSARPLHHSTCTLQSRPSPLGRTPTPLSRPATAPSFQHSCHHRHACRRSPREVKAYYKNKSITYSSAAILSARIVSTRISSVSRALYSANSGVVLTV